ncbi:MAG: type II toxin-antitoxin system Phd/YefM family antitoxin [Balneolales bacterium]|nr:type II toxin-antitoxin system Phd/YefM family antitoxin [Balneolales bacterium]
MKKTISITEFKARCLEIIREVQEDAVSYTVTKHDKVVAEVSKPTADLSGINPLKDSILHEDDLVSPIDETWEADR